MITLAPITTTVNEDVCCDARNCERTALIGDIFCRFHRAEEDAAMARMEAKPLPLPSVVGTSIAYIWGAQDAAAGLACIPEMQWVQRRDQRDYAAGWASIAGHNNTTRFFMGGN